MLYTVQDMLKPVGRKLNGTGVDPTCEPGLTQALEGLNTATRMLMVEERCFVAGYFCLPVTGNTLTLDRRIRAIVTAKASRNNAMSVFSQGIKFIDGVEFARTEGIECQQSLELIGTQFATHRDLDKARLIFATSDRPEAPDATLTVIGYDEQGKELRTTSADGSVQMSKGITSPIIMSACDVAPRFNCGDGFHRGLVKTITALRKPRTNGYVQVWGLDEYSGEVYWLTTLAPDETSPSQTRYRLNGWKGVCPASLFVYAVMQFAPMYDLNDISLIQQPDALDDMTQALAAKDSGNYGTYQTYRNSALALLRKDRRSESGTDHRLNVAVNKTPLEGRNFSMRGWGSRRVIR